MLEVEKRVLNWITEEKSNSVLKSHREKEQAKTGGRSLAQQYRPQPPQQPRREDLMQSRLRQEDLLQQRYLQEQEEKTMRMLM